MTAHTLQDTPFNAAQSNSDVDTVSQIIADNHSVPTISEIATERKIWEEGAYRTSNQQLYTVLSHCLAYFEQLSACKSKKDPLREQFDNFVASNDIKFKSSTSLVNKVVKCVFYDSSLDRIEQRDRRRISAYSTVLTRALSENITAEQLANFIEGKGGIEQIRLNNSVKKSMSDKAAESRTAVESTNNYLAVISDHALMQQFDATDYDKAFVAVVVPRGDGSLEVRQIVKSESAINSSLASLHKQVVEANSSETVTA